MVTYGKGPWVTPTRSSKEQRDGSDQSLSGFFEPTGLDGEWQGTKGYPNNLTIIYFFLDQLEAAVKKNDAS